MGFPGGCLFLLKLRDLLVRYFCSIFIQRPSQAQGEVTALPHLRQSFISVHSHFGYTDEKRVPYLTVCNPSAA